MQQHDYKGVVDRRAGDALDSTPPTVYIVDDDVWVQRALERLMDASGYLVSAFGSATEFLAAHDPDLIGCVILDLAMPEFSGLDLQRTLNESGCRRPVIFLTGCGSVSLSVQAMKSGAISFLTKPIIRGELLSAVCEAVCVDRLWRSRRARQDIVRKRVASLTSRERQVLEHLLDGRLNKQIAAALGTCEQTIKVHRARVMRKMAVRSVAELVWLAATSEVVALRPMLQKLVVREVEMSLSVRPASGARQLD
jgi:FixJ family two-component response regulator